MKKFERLLLVLLCNLMVFSFFIVNGYANTTAQHKVHLVNGNIEGDVTFNGWVGTITVDLPVATPKATGGYTVNTVEKLEIPVIRMTTGDAISIKITKGGSPSATALAYPGVYTYNKINSTDYAFVDSGQIGLAQGNTTSASIMYNLPGLTNGIIQYYDTTGNPLFTMGYKYVLVLDETTETSFLTTGKLSITDTYGWPGLKKLLEENPDSTEKTASSVNSKEQILQNILKNAKK